MTKTANPNTACTLQLSSKNPKTSENKFEATMIEAIDESLGSFKSLNTQEVYSHLENAFEIRKQEIPCKIEDFTDAMEQMFGIGAKLVEIRIIKAVHKRMPEFMFTPRRGAVIFTEYVDSLRAFLLQPA
jgi:hypothetical protein